MRAGAGGTGSAGGGRTGTGSALTCSSVRTSGGALRAVLKVSIEATNSCSLGRLAAAFDALEDVVLEADDDPAQLRRRALAPDREDVVPAIGVERVGEERRAEHVAHLGAGQAGLDERRPARW